MDYETVSLLRTDIQDLVNEQRTSNLLTLLPHIEHEGERKILLEEIKSRLGVV